tara:strand:+ start:657 stop:926 length:270 start_codon:yes stop_codon:yes gene_type:complete
MIGCFVAGVVVSRLMNHQDVVTGDVKEGAWSNETWVDVVGVTLIILLIISFLGVGVWMVWTGNHARAATARKKLFRTDVDPNSKAMNSE